MLVNRNNTDLHEKAIVEHTIAENVKLKAHIEYLAVMGGYDELLDDDETETEEEE
mgnify:CR=1 FL=1